MIADHGIAMRFVSTCRLPTNTYGETHCASCRATTHSCLGTADAYNRTKLRDAELVEPLLRRYHGKYHPKRAADMLP